TIAKIHSLLMERYASYETRRIDVRQTLLTDLEDRARAGQISPSERGQMLADLRLLALRELMKYEMPDRWSDVLGTELGNAAVNPIFLNRRPALAEAYIRRSANATTENEGAECL